MIIVMRVSPANESAAKKLAADTASFYQYYPLPIEGKNRQFTKITLLDLTADELDSLPGARSIIDYLAENQLLDALQTIDVLIPDIDNTLPQFTVDLKAILKDSFSKDVTVRSCTDIQYDYTFISPPQAESASWEVYGVQKKDISASQSPSLYNLAQVKKALLWKGDNLEDLLANRKPKLAAGNSAPSLKS